MSKPRVYGYARTSTLKQKLQRQINSIKKEFPDAIMITEQFTGTTINRPEFDKLIKKLKAGDLLIFDEVSRMSRNAEEGFALYEELYNRGISLKFLKEPHIDTDTYREALKVDLPTTGTEVDYVLEGLKQMLMALAKKQIELAFKTAQAEVDLLHERTSGGVRAAHERYLREEALGLPHEKNDVGIPKGTKLITKKSIECKKRIKELSRNFNGNNTDAECIKILGINRNTFYKYKKQLTEES